jgi:hypothetical protein
MRLKKSQLQRCLQQRCKVWTRYLNSEGDYVEWATRTKARVYFAIASVREIMDTFSYILLWFNSDVTNRVCPSSGHHSHCAKTMAKRILQLCSNEWFIKTNLPSHIGQRIHEFTNHYRQKVRSTWERKIKLEIFHSVKGNVYLMAAACCYWDTGVSKEKTTSLLSVNTYHDMRRNLTDQSS